MNKTPYEVRLDVMKMAQEMLDREAQTEETKFYMKLETLRTANASKDEINNFIDTYKPKVYNENDVVARSSALYNFVTDSTRNKP
jgi:phage tail sheath gpL-like